MLPFQHRIHRVHEVMKGVFGLVALSETTADMGKSEGFPFVTQNVVGSVTFGSPGGGDYHGHPTEREAYVGDTTVQGAEDDVTFAE